jgi:hypothetical protein
VRLANGNVIWRRPHFARNPGSRGRASSKKARIAATATVTVALVGGGTAAIDMTTSASSAAHPPADEGGRPDFTTSMTISDAQADLRNVESALLLHWGRIDGAIDTSNDCTDNSYGQVQKFFQANPCKWVFRAYLAMSANSTTDTPAMMIAISWVYMPSASSAYAYMRLADTWGTGNVTELSRDVGPYKDVMYSGKYYESGIRGTTVWNAEAQPTSSVTIPVVETALADAHQ